MKGALGRDLGRLGAVLELSWGRPGTVLGPSWTPVGLSWAPFGPLDALLGSSWAFQVDTSECAKTSNNLNTYCIFGPQGVPRGVPDEPSLGSCWLPKRSKIYLRSISSHTDTLVASQGRSRNHFGAVSGPSWAPLGLPWGHLGAS